MAQSSPEVDSTPLDLDDDLSDVKRELTPVAANWKSIGIALQLQSNILDRIEAGNSGDPTACLTSMVTEWLKRKYHVNRFGEPTWKQLVEAVGDPAGGNNKKLARNIARRHKAKSEKNERDMGEIPRKRKAESGISMPATKTAKIGDTQRSRGTILAHIPGSKYANVRQASSNTGAHDTSEGWPATSTVDEECGKEIRKLARRSPLVLVTAGIPGAGKSTLINNLLGLKGNKAAKAKMGMTTTTKSVDYYEEEVHGITMRIIDTPGLDAKDLSSKEIEEELATLSVLTDGKADILLYCMKLTDRSDERDERIVRKLTKTFGKEIWKHTILVLTFGDVVLKQDEEDRDLLEEFTEDFEQVLKKTGVSDIPVSILSAQDNEVESTLAKIQQSKIIGIPVGRHTHTPQNWTDLLFKEVIKRCEFDAVPAILMLQGVQPEWVAKVLMEVVTLGGFVLGGCAIGLIGASLGAVVGSAFGGVGAVPGAEVGTLIGVVAGSCGGGFLADASSKWHIAELTGLAKIIKARKRVEELKQKKKNVGK